MNISNDSDRMDFWKQFVIKRGFTDLVSPEDKFTALLTTKAKWLKSKEAGIYVWIAENGEVYVGQSKSLIHRLRQHYKVHPDIELAAVKYCSLSELDALERQEIEACEKEFPTRNIIHAFATSAFSPLDSFINENERNSFLGGENLIGRNKPRPLEILHQKSAAKFSRLAKIDDFDFVTKVIRIYVERCIPKPWDTEARFWSLTAYAANGNLIRLNVGQQEVFTLVYLDGQYYARILALDVLGEYADGPFYQTNSYCNWVPIADLSAWLTPARYIEVRKLVVRLMRHSVALNRNSHCPQLVRAAFQK